MRYSRGDAVNGFSVTGMGYRGDVELDRPGAAARDRRGAHRPVRRDRPDRRRRHLPLQRLARVAADAQQRDAPRSPPTASATTSTCSRTSPSSSTIRCTAISSTRPITASSPARKVSYRRIDRWGGREVQNTVGVQLRNDDITDGRPLSHRGAAAARHGAPGRRARDERRRLRAERDRVDAVAAHAGRPARRRLPLPRRRRRSGERRHATRAASSARRAASSSGRSGAPSSTSTPASAFTATTRAARRSRAIRRPATPVDRGHAARAREGRGSRRPHRRDPAPADAA